MRVVPFVCLVGACSAAPAKQPPPKQPPPTAPAAPRESDSVAINDDEAQRFADLLTSEAENTGSVPESDMSSRRPSSGASLKEQVDEVKASGGKVVIGYSGRARGEGGSAKVGTGTGLKIDGPATSGQKDTSSGRISIMNSSERDKTTLAKDTVIAKISSAYMAGVKRCYKQYLNKDATARGRVVLKLGVNMSGRAIGSAAGFNGEVDACITGLMGMWSFPVPKDDAGDSAEASFDITLQLLPD